MIFQSWCQMCCSYYHPVMLTSYCMESLECDRCHRVGTLAIIKVNGLQLIAEALTNSAA